MNRLVIRAPNWLGDAVMALPAMGAVRAAFPDAHLAVAAVRSIAPIFEQETSAGQDSVIVAARRRASEVAALAAGRFDAVVLLPNSFRSAWSARRAAIPERWGYAGGLAALAPDPRGVAARAGASTNPPTTSSSSRGLGLAAGDPWPRIGVRAATLARADALLAAHDVAPGSRIVGFAPGRGVRAREALAAAPRRRDDRAAVARGERGVRPARCRRRSRLGA